MHRNALRKMLENYSSTVEEESAYKSQLKFLEEHEDCFERSCEVGHFTGSCWVENPDGTKFLLTLHKKIGLWLQLGGHADGNCDLAQVALKEAYEESGLNHIELVSKDIFDVDVHLIAEHKGIPAHYHYDVRFLLRATDENIKISDESSDLRWFSELPSDNLGASVVHMYEKWKKLHQI